MFREPRSPPRRRTRPRARAKPKPEPLRTVRAVTPTRPAPSTTSSMVRSKEILTGVPEIATISGTPAYVLSFDHGAQKPDRKIIEIGVSGGSYDPTRANPGHHHSLRARRE